MSDVARRGALGYIRGLLVHIGRANCVRLAERVACSHDALTRTLTLARLNAEAYLASIALACCGTLQNGYLVIDDTTVDKRHASVIEGCSWIYSSAERRHTFGYSLVVLAWTDGKRVVPLRFEVYRKTESGRQRTKTDIAVSLLVYAQNVLKTKPDAVLFDAFYAADKIIKRCEQYGWGYCGRVKRNRTLDGVQVRRLHRNPYWDETGRLSCREIARVVRWGKRYFITNDVDRPRKAVVELYGNRWKIEEVFRVLHSTLGLDECESRSLVAQHNHFMLVMLAYGVLESERTRTGATHYALVHELRLTPQLVETIDISRLVGFA